MKIRMGAYIGIIAILLLIPLVAMRHTTEVRWGPLDFLMMCGLLTGVAVIVELSTRKWKTRAEPQLPPRGCAHAAGGLFPALGQCGRGHCRC